MNFIEKMEGRIAKPRSHRVILRRCDTFNHDQVQGIIKESFEELGIKPCGKVLIKPNVVTANKAYIHHAYTDPRIVAEAVKAMMHQRITKVTVGESGGYGIPSRLFLKEAGYFDLEKLGVHVVDFNVEPTVKVPLSRGMHHKHMLVAQSIHEADTLVWMPKLKYHICCTTTCALKLNVGILNHKERMLYHDDRLDEKIVDLLEVGYPDAVITDAIEVGHGYESAPHTIHLGAIMIADDPVAMDIVANQMLSFDPHDCVHLTMAMDRGYGPKTMDAVKIEGDISLEELQANTNGFESEYQDIHKVNTPIKFFCGTDPDRGRLCHGGCIAGVKGALGTIDKRRPGSVAKAKPGAIVTGIYKGDVDVGDGVVLMIGDCTKVEGKITARKVKRIGGCPVGTKQLLMGLPMTFGLSSPMMDVKDAFLFIGYSIDKAFRKFLAYLQPKSIE